MNPAWIITSATFTEETLGSARYRNPIFRSYCSILDLRLTFMFIIKVPAVKKLPGRCTVRTSFWLSIRKPIEFYTLLKSTAVTTVEATSWTNCAKPSTGVLPFRRSLYSVPKWNLWIFRRLKQKYLKLPFTKSKSLTIFRI